VADVAAALEALAGQSLIRAMESAESRFTMLATIGEFASEQLEASDEAAVIRQRHAAFFRRFAEQAYVESRGPAADPWFDRLEADLDNLRVAIARAASDRDLPTALAIAGSLGPFSLQRNHSAEGRRILAGLIERPDVPAGREFAGAVGAAAYMDAWLGDYPSAARMGELAVAAYRQLGDRAGLSDALGALGFATIERDPKAALAMFDESLALTRELGDVRAEARLPLARAIALFRLGRLADARASLERSVELTRQTGDRYVEMMSRYPLARTKLLMGDTADAMRDYQATLEESRALDLRIGVAVGLDNYAEVSVWSGDVRRGVRLAAAAARMKEELGGGPPANMIGAVDPLVVGRDKLGVEEFEREVAAGRAMDVDTAVAEALATQAPAGPPPMAQPEPA
jgi:non-specific serine/threonine protein kinase